MRSYYDKDWHCDCESESHTLENYIKSLHNMFDSEYEKAHVTYDEKYIYVDIRDNCVLALKIFQLEFHGLILSSIHSRPREQPFESEISFLFNLPRNTLQTSCKEERFN